MQKVSIVVPVYNASETISRCVTSIISQSHMNLQIILIDDGSTDNSLDKLLQYASNDTRIEVVSKQNGGVSSARNLGLDIAIGDYIVFVDSDDYLHNNMVEYLLINALKNNAEVVECGYATVKNKKKHKEYHFKPKTIHGQPNILNNFIAGNNGADSICNKIYKREAIDKLRLSNYKYSEDFLFNINILSNINTYVTINKILYYYVIDNENSSTNVPLSKENFEDIEIRENLIKYFSDNKKSTDTLNYLYSSILKKIIFLDIRLVKSNSSNKDRISKYLDNKFKFYFKIIKKSNITKITPHKIKVLIILRSINKHIYWRILTKRFD